MPSPSIPEPLFYHPALGRTGEVVLTDAEAHHVTVQRLRIGDAVALFDGRGHVARGRIEHVGRQAVRIAVTQREHHAPPAPAIDLYTALPKGDRQAMLLDMAAQLGMRRFAPVRWRRSVAEPGARAPQRWHRICVEACKQSRRLHVPQVVPVTPLAQAIAAARADGARLLLAHPGRAAGPVLDIDLSGTSGCALFVGPEGGITNEEAETLRASGADFARLGAAILRIETAAVALIAVVQAVFERSAAPR